MERERISVALLGATGSVGQQFVTLLANHPWFRLTSLLASPRSAGKPYREAVRWFQPEELPQEAGELIVGTAGQPLSESLVFSALDAEVAGEIEAEYARQGKLVVSNARNHRMAPHVPLVIPEVNPGHLELIQPGQGGIITNPNCSTIGLALALKPLHDAFGVARVHVTTLQAVSGAGYPGVPSLDIMDNVVPFISGEEEKMETEPRKILGRVSDGQVQPAEVLLSAQCTRVPVVDGHTECVSVLCHEEPELARAEEAFRLFQSPEEVSALPTAPERPLVLLREGGVPQPRLHRGSDRGMRVTVGRLRSCPIQHLRFVLVSHNTLRGAAGGALLCGELALARGKVPGVEPAWSAGRI